MFYYAIVNDNCYCTSVVSSATEIHDNHYIEITEEQYTSQSVVGMYWNVTDVLWDSIRYFSCNTYDIDYDRTGKVLQYQFDDMNEAIAAKADVNHTHSDAVTLTKLASIMGGHYTLPTTITKGANYSTVTGSATLVGNMLRVTFSATRNSAASGNIDNEILATFSIAHGGKILGGYAVNFNNATSGHVCNMNVSSVSCNDTTLTFNVNLNATAGDTTSINTYFALPVIVDVTKY